MHSTERHSRSGCGGFLDLRLHNPMCGLALCIQVHIPAAGMLQRADDLL